MSIFNSNAFHNLINLLLVVLSALVGYDWTQFGVSPEMALHIVAAIGFAAGLLKLVVNTTRDGVTGLVKPQLPVGTVPAATQPPPK